MQQYNITGMSCAACSARVEKAVSKVPGVTTCSVSLLTNSMGVDGTADTAAIVAAVENAGYGAALKSVGNAAGAAGANTAPASTSDYDALADRETPVLKKRLIASASFVIVLMYFSMGHMMWGWPIPAFFDGNHVAVGLIQLILAGIVMVINQKFFINGFRGLIHRAPNMDTLVALGSMASFVYSTVMLFAVSDAQLKGDLSLAHEYMHEFYFESAAMILALITVGKMLEARSKGKTTDALKSLMKLAPQTAVLLIDGQETTVPINQVKKGDIFVVRPGESIPVDGVVTEGHSAVNEAALTGESIPVDKEAGDLVSAATINQSGFLKCEAARVGEDTTLSQIIRMVSDAAATKAPIAKVADKVSGIFVPIVITISLITIAAWLLVGQTVGFALARGISVLVISCPCALGLATPVAIMVGNGVGAKNGILFKTAVSLENTGRTQIVVLDKTGTITAGEPRVTDIIPADGYSDAELASLALSLEQYSEHPLARAIISYGTEHAVMPSQITDFEALPGNGLTAKLNDIPLFGGNLKFITKYIDINSFSSAHEMLNPDASNISEYADLLASQGKTPLFFAYGSKLVGIIAVADVIKEDSPQAVKELQNMGISVVMLTGDNAKTAAAIGKQAGVDNVIAGVLPDGKENVIKELKKYGKVTMVGDGINDAPALTRADIGIAIGAGADVAVDAADVVLMKSRLSDVPAAIRLSRAALTNIHQNLFWAFIYNTIGIPLAAGLFIPILGFEMNPMFGAAAMSLSSFCVVTNALRLNFFKLHDASGDRRISSIDISFLNTNGSSNNGNADNDKKETDTMEKTMKIEGMMCMHCENRVKKALEALDDVEEAVVSHENGTAVVKLNADIANDILKNAVEAQDYPVTDIR